jgi:hypothetical protein
MALRGIRLDPEEGELIDTLRMVDISKSGMGAYLDRQAYPGQRFVLCLPMTESSGRRNVYATVTRCRSKSDGYHVGLHFDNVSAGAWYGISTTAAAA